MALRSAAFRPLGVAAAAVIAVQFVLGGKPYYPGGVYTFLFAAGAAALFTGAAPGRPGPPRGRIAWYCLGAVICSVISLPVLPATALARFPAQKVNYDLGEQIGWPSEVRLLASVWRALPAPERGRTTLLAGNYGEAGAVDRYGPSLGLPAVYSGANNFWLWGPPPAADTAAVAIGIDPALLRREFTQVKLVGRWNNGLGVADDEQGTPVYLATGLRGSWGQAWPAFRHYD